MKYIVRPPQNQFHELQLLLLLLTFLNCTVTV